MNKREVIFPVPQKEYGNYRVVCQFGYDSMIDTNWWGYLQKEELVKNWPWSKPKLKWVDVDDWWWAKNKNSMDELKQAAIDQYKDIVECREKIIEKAMSL